MIPTITYLPMKPRVERAWCPYMWLIQRGLIVAGIVVALLWLL
jgi:hypothetical protein